MSEQNKANYIVRLNTKTFLGFKKTEFLGTYSIKNNPEDAYIFRKYYDAKRHADNVGGTVMSLEYVIKEVEDENDERTTN